MSSNKTIKALREERELLHAEVRRLQALAGEPPTLRQLARDARVKALNCPVLADNLARLWMARVKPPSLQLLEAVDKVAATLPPIFLGYGSREEMQASREAIRPYQSDLYRELTGDPAAFARYYLGEFKAPEPDWTQAPPDASHALAKDPEHIFWLKLGWDHQPAEIWLPDRFEWAKTVATSGERRQSPHVLARPAPKEKWSLNGQNGAWDYDSLAELIRDNYGHTRDSAGPMGCDSDLVEGSTVYRAIECKDDPAGFLPGTDDVLEHMSERAYDSDAGEWADNYPEVDDAAKAELEKALEPLQAWARKHCQPEFFTVKNITPYTITAEDVNQ